MSGFYDVYSLVPARTVSAVECFLERFVSKREPARAEYEVPQSADQQKTLFAEAYVLMAWCVLHPSEPYAIYWRSLRAGDPFHAMAFFTTDGGLILGLSVLAEPQRWLTELLTATEGRAGWIGFEEPPPFTGKEFLEMAASNDEPRT